MSDHLPECPWAHRGYAFPCICDRLRSCEARVREEADGDLRGWIDAGYAEGRAAALDAARDAVAALPKVMTYDRDYDDIQRGEALAAIDALREEKR